LLGEEKFDGEEGDKGADGAEGVDSEEGEDWGCGKTLPRREYLIRLPPEVQTTKRSVSSVSSSWLADVSDLELEISVEVYWIFLKGSLTATDERCADGRLEIESVPSHEVRVFVLRFSCADGGSGGDDGMLLPMPLSPFSVVKPPL